MEIIKIRNKEGLYSNGGMSPSFTKEGKAWTRRTFNSHISMLAGYIKRRNHSPFHLKFNDGKKVTWHDFYKDCELVIFKEVSNEPLDRELFIKAL